MPEPSFPGRFVRQPILLLVSLVLPGCWTPARVQTQPPGPTRIIQSGIAVQWYDAACKRRRHAQVTVFVSPDGMLPASLPEKPSMRATAKVLSVDVSYRLLRVQYSDSRDQTFKVARNVALANMQSGDDVLIQLPEDPAASACKP